MRSQRLLRPNGGEFSPRDLAGLALWLDGSDTQSLQTVAPNDFGLSNLADPYIWLDANDGSYVGTGDNGVEVWDSKGYVGNGLYNPTGLGITRVTLPESNRQVMRFTGSGYMFQDWGSLAFPNGMTAVVVFSHPATQNVVAPTLVFEGNGGSLYVSATLNDTAATFDGSFGQSVAGFPSLGIHTVHISSSGQVSTRRNGQSSGASSTISTSSLDFQYIGVGGPADGYSSFSNFTGDIAEILIYDSALSVSKIKEIEGLLAEKWAIAGVTSSVAQELTPISSPTELSNLDLWWDFSDESKVSTDGSGNVTSVAASYGGVSLVPAVSGYTCQYGAIVNGKKTIRFEGDYRSRLRASTLGAADPTTPMTVLVAVRPDADAPPLNKGIVGKYSAGDPADSRNFNIGYYPPSQGSPYTLAVRASYRQGTVNYDSTTSVTFPTSADSGIVSLVAQPGYFNLRASRSGSQYTATAAQSYGANPSVAYLTVGGTADGGAYYGSICEIIIYRRILSESERQRAEHYLALKWQTSPAFDPVPPVGYWADKSANNRHATQATAASRPTVTTVNGRKALAFDGANGWMKTDRTVYAARSVFAVFRRTATVSQATYKGPFAKQAGTTDSAYGGTASASAQPGGWSASATGGNNRLYWNNAALTASFHNGASISVADSSNYQVGFPAPLDTTTPAVLYAEVSGEASGNQCWFVGTEPYSSTRKYPADFCEALIYSRALTSTERRRVEQYLANRWGITLAPQVSDPDAQDWINRVYANGGGVSTATASAVNTFCESIAAAGIRSKFYRLNLFAGTATASLANCGCLVPLYLGPSLGGTQYGGATDTVNGFTVGNYVEGVGLTGNGSTSWLNPGNVTSLKPSWTTHHFGIDIANAYPDTTNRYQMGAFFNETPTSPRGNYAISGTSTSGVGYSGTRLRAGFTTASNLKTVVRAASNDLRIFEDGSQVGTTQTTADTATVIPGGNFMIMASSYQNVSSGTPTTIVNGYASAVGTGRGYTIGESMNDTQMAAFAAAWIAVQQTLGRR